MPRKCTVCTHEQREEIDDAIVGGDSYRTISRHYAVSKDAVGRHARAHLAKELLKAQEVREVARADDLLARLNELTQDAQRILQKAERAKRYSTALSGIRELTRLVRLQAELVGELNRQTQINVILMPQWTQMRAVIVAALEPYPEAGVAAARALLAAEGTVVDGVVKAH